MYNQRAAGKIKIDNRRNPRIIKGEKTLKTTTGKVNPIRRHREPGQGASPARPVGRKNIPESPSERAFCVSRHGRLAARYSRKPLVKEWVAARPIWVVPRKHRLSSQD